MFFPVLDVKSTCNLEINLYREEYDDEKTCVQYTGIKHVTPEIYTTSRCNRVDPFVYCLYSLTSQRRELVGLKNAQARLRWSF